MHVYQVLVRPILTEKTNAQSESSARYTFQVDPRANKHMVRDAVQKVFNVHVVDVNILTVRGKTRRFGRHESRLPDWKKAMVTLAQGENISFFEGV